MSSDKNDIYNVIIVGAGPAGLTAAIYTARGNLSPLVIEGYMAGGQLMLTSEVENYPGFKDGVMGVDLIMACRSQAERFGAGFVNGDVTKVELEGDIKKLWVEDKLYLTKAVIIATGSSANMLGLESEKRMIGKGVSSCATCDGFFFREKTVCIVGGGDSALEEAIFLTRFASKVYIIHRRKGFRASKILLQKGENNPKIEFITDTIITEVLGDKVVTGVKIKNTQTNKEEKLKVDGMFVTIGHTPNTKLFENIVDVDAKGYIITSADKSGLTATNIKGVFACGDVQDSRYRQAITASGSGCMAALDTEQYLESLEE